MEKNKTHFNEFSLVSKDEWLAKLEKDLKGKPLEDLNWQLGNNVVVPPFYHSEDADENWHPLSAERPNNDWEISEDIIVKSPKEANEIALHALEYGANSLRFILRNKISKSDLATLLKDINVEFISTHFQIFHKDQLEVIHDFYDLVKNDQPENIKGSVNFDFGKKIQKAELEAWKEALNFAKENLPQFKLITIDGANLSVSTENTAARLAEILKRGTHLFDLFLENGFSKSDLQNQFQFSLPIGKSYFVEIAKIRAFKILWANVMSAYGMENIISPTIEIHFLKNELTEDANTNMIHATTQAMSAVIGGANRLTVLPADKKGNAFTKRIARNVQHILKMESFMNRVHDPAAGSYYIEKLTEQLADKAWGIFST